AGLEEAGEGSGLARSSSQEREPLRQPSEEPRRSTLRMSHKTPYERMDAEREDEGGSTSSGQGRSEDGGTPSEDSRTTQEAINFLIWRALIREGWKFRRLDRLPASDRQRYKKQLEHEMKLIEEKGFFSYFMLVRAGVVFAKEQGYAVGPARGSAAASLAAWLLRITEVDPLRPEFAGLLDFGRFISVDRLDLPDIDLDFPSEARPLVRRFYTELMGGEDRVNNVGTFMQFKGKNSLDDVARVFQVPPYEVSRIKDFLIERSSGDMRASSTIWDTIEQFEQPRQVVERFPDLKKADLLEGNVKAFGVHAAALVLSNEPITNVTAVIEREVPRGSGNWITCVALDKKDAERQGMVKMDFLGLNTMSMIQRALGWLGKDIDWLYGLPLDDPRVYALLP